VWTPRRILLLVFGFVFFFAIYLGYGFTAIGRIDGLPPLPETCFPQDSPVVRPEIRKRKSELEKKLEMAFGENCEELRRAIRLDLQSRGMLLSAGTFKVDDDGRVLLQPVSFATISKPRGNEALPEINTIRGEIAHLKFDRPIKSLSEIGTRKLVEAEITNRIHIISNRRRPNHDQDLIVDIQNGPLHFSDERHLIWTTDRVDVEDHKSQPEPHLIKGQGMDMELAVETPKDQPNQHHKGETISGVKRIVLYRHVSMKLFLDSKSGFLAGSQQNAEAKQAPPPVAAAQGGPLIKPYLEIQGPGRFTYDLLKDHDFANFDIPDAINPRVPEVVKVTRHNPDPTKKDRLECDHLDLRLLRKEAGHSTPGTPGSKQEPAKPGEHNESGLDIETAHATSRRDQNVVLTSDAENLSARGNDFTYDAAKKLTILKSASEVEVNRGTSTMLAREVRIQDKPLDPPLAGQLEARQVRIEPKPATQPASAKVPPKMYQEITARGPGVIHMSEKGSERKTMHAYWQEWLVSTKDGGNDLLTLTGAARMVDEKEDQTIKGDVIKIWFDPAAPKQPREATQSANASPMQNYRPQHLEATGENNVMARSREMNIHDTCRLVVWFKDVPPETLPPPSNPQNKPAKQAPKTPAPDGKTAPAVPAPSSQPPGPARMPTAVQASKPAVGPIIDSPRPESAPMSTSPLPPSVIVDNASRSPGTLPVGPAVQAPPAPRPPAPMEEKEPVAQASVQPKGDPARPIDLTARSVESWVLRAGERNVLDKVHCEGKVHVRQDPARPEEKDTDIQGDTLDMEYNPLGNLLVVYGDLAQLRMDKIYIIGPQVNIDQATNRAWVNGVGAMQMESATNFQGEKLNKSVPLTVHWQRGMRFYGDRAIFSGGIQAEQERARMACQELEVDFDKMISLKQQTNKDKQQDAKVRNMVCDRDVRIEDQAYEGTERTKYQLITGPAAQVTANAPDEGALKGDNPGNHLNVSGPGTVRLMQKGSIDPAAGPSEGGGGAKKSTSAKPGEKQTGGTPRPGANPAAPAKPGEKPKKADGSEDEMKMTFVAFGNRMSGDSRAKKAQFWGDVRVLNFPCQDPYVPIDLDKPYEDQFPPGWMYMRCDRLKVYDIPENGKSNQQMEAHGRVYVQAKEFYARSEDMYYNQAKDQVIFDSPITGTATFYKVAKPGDKVQTFTGRKIIYDRKTGAMSGDGVQSGEGLN
jgi:hypothetical protein